MVNVSISEWKGTLTSDFPLGRGLSYTLPVSGAFLLPNLLSVMTTQCTMYQR